MCEPAPGPALPGACTLNLIGRRVLTPRAVAGARRKSEWSAARSEILRRCPVRHLADTFPLSRWFSCARRARLTSAPGPGATARADIHFVGRTQLSSTDAPAQQHATTTTASTDVVPATSSASEAGVVFLSTDAAALHRYASTLTPPPLALPLQADAMRSPGAARDEPQHQVEWPSELAHTAPGSRHTAPGSRHVASRGATTQHAQHAQPLAVWERTFLRGVADWYLLSHCDLILAPVKSDYSLSACTPHGEQHAHCPIHVGVVMSMPAPGRCSDSLRGCLGDRSMQPTCRSCPWGTLFLSHQLKRRRTMPKTA